ncbi:MAG: hypothetical protein AMXMBFR64_41030 [Myxococcales bacterium]
MTQSQTMKRQAMVRRRPGGRRTLLAGCAALALAGSGTMAADAKADIKCNTLPSPIYGQGGSANTNFLGKIAAAWRTSDKPVALIYQSPGACVGINSLLSDTAITGTAFYWEADGTQGTCELPLLGQKLDFAVMGIDATSCAGIDALPKEFGDFTGVINSWNLLVPVASSQQSVSAEALYFVFGFGKAGKAAPWTDEEQIIARNGTSAVQIAIAKAIGVPPAKFVGVDAKTNQATITLLAGSPKPEAAIGFTSGEVADDNRDVVRTLAYQHTDQICGYWPDSTATAFDKSNVRFGQYYLWSPTHVFTRVGANGKPSNPNVALLAGWIDGTVTPPKEVPILDLTIENKNIPKCAMYVDRSSDSGPLFSVVPDAPCGCYFEWKAVGKTDCASCKSDSDCPSSAPVCRHDFCEVK